MERVRPLRHVRPGPAAEITIGEPWQLLRETEAQPQLEPARHPQQGGDRRRLDQQEARRQRGDRRQREQALAGQRQLAAQVDESAQHEAQGDRAGGRQQSGGADHPEQGGAALAHQLPQHPAGPGRRLGERRLKVLREVGRGAFRLEARDLEEYRAADPRDRVAVPVRRRHPPRRRKAGRGSAPARPAERRPAPAPARLWPSARRAASSSASRKAASRVASFPQEASALASSSSAAAPPAPMPRAASRSGEDRLRAVRAEPAAHRRRRQGWRWR